MMYLYIDEEKNRLHCISKYPIKNGHHLNQDHHIELIVPDDFTYQRPIVDENGKNTFEDLSAEEILNSITYREQRAVNYPSIQEQLDTLYHQGYDGWKSSIDEIKNLYPKE